MFIDPSNMLNEMCGALPVSAEDAPGLQAAADRLRNCEMLDTLARKTDAAMRLCDEQLSRDLIDAARAEAVGG
jgi:hypothetical protein